MTAIADNLIEAPSPNHDARPAPIDMIVLHYTGMQSGEAAIARLRSPEARVSSHYVVEEDGRVLRLVREERRAWHAGVSRWAGRDNLNDVSVGIEIVNPGHEWGYRAFPEPQIQAVEALVEGIRARHFVRPQRVVGHSDIAPTRKDDPGELFPWLRLAKAGHSIWVDEANDLDPGKLLDPQGIAELGEALGRVGYDTRMLIPALIAFRRRFRQNAIEGPPMMRDYIIARALTAELAPHLGHADAPITSGEFSR